ncbi:TIGR03943 family protein [Sphaerisporangium melleum]|uniref:TIGR03943 family protein n=1 Tax=Sphaerisporangium melleum TaxID=321316 RepID=A0A917VK43_9ACTN|nr:TIGR03943 family protein [Sphaerisporangium melleum]GGK92236.1 TIGR03943 family protein [Sphaerisporangium melleum]GII72992.1 TIGR03943 family protein [Sphaerisporangium melleum]
MAQSLVLTLLGGALLRVSAFSDLYLNYVKPGFRVPLVLAGAVLLVLGLLGLAEEWRRPYHAPPGKDGHDSLDGEDPAGSHGHARGPRVAWLLCLPVVAIFLISPPALGSFAAARQEAAPVPRPPAASTGYAALAADRATAMPIGEFIGRAWSNRGRSLAGRRVRLTGFAVPAEKKDQWYLTRMQLRCCAADAFPLKVAVVGAPAPRPDTWVEVTGTWVATPYEELPKGTVAPALTATALTKVTRPAEPYE